MKLISKSLAAVAVTMALGCGVAQASTLAATAVTFSQQGQTLSGITAAQWLPQISVTLGADYSVNDNITLRIAGATVGGNTNANLTVPANLVCGGGAIIVSFITRTGNDIFLRVTQKTVTDTVGLVCTVGGAATTARIEVTAPSLTTLTTVTATWSATTAITNIPFDAGNTLTLASVVDQFTSGPITALNGIVDVNDPSLRRDFTVDDGGNIAGNEDTLSVATYDKVTNTAFTGPVATLTGVTAIVNGDFSFVDDDVPANGCTLADFGAGAGRIVALENGAGTAAPSVNSSCQTITWVYTPGADAGPVTHTFAFGKTAAASGRVITAPQTFGGSVTYNYTGVIGAASETDTVAAPGLGEWRLNGFSAFVAYMPYDAAAGISQIIYLSNKSAQSGAVTIDAYNQAGVPCNFSAGTVNAARVTSLAGPIRTGLEACYGPGFNDRISMTVIANIPAGRAELNTAYNVNGNRVQVTNTSNGRVTLGGDSTTGGQL